jgi:hypothetical protein
MLLLSILYRLVRCLVGLITMLARRDLSKDAELLVLRHEKRGVAPTDRPRALHACRSDMDGCLVSAAPTLTLERGLLGHSCHDPGLAPQAGLAQLGLHGPPSAWASTDASGNQEASHSDGDRESHLGPPARAG